MLESNLNQSRDYTCQPILRGTVLILKDRYLQYSLLPAAANHLGAFPISILFQPFLKLPQAPVSSIPLQANPSDKATAGARLGWSPQAKKW